MSCVYISGGGELAACIYIYILLLQIGIVPRKGMKPRLRLRSHQHGPNLDLADWTEVHAALRGQIPLREL